MNPSRTRSTRRFRPALGRPTLGLGVVAAASVLVGGCLERPIQPVEPRTTSTIIEKLTQSSVDKIDILLAIDNSRSMADKQKILAAAVPDLVKGLVNPSCVNPETGEVATTPGSPLDECPAGTKREFEPVVNIHIGIVSSSLGGLQNACDDGAAGLDDKGRLISRDPANPAQNVATYLNKGFLAWDPTQQKLPKLNSDGSETGDFEPGEADIDTDSGADANDTALVPQLASMVRGVGQLGCGYEASLESAYRFLVDPQPYEQLTLVGSEATPQGVDQVILDQRRDFLRPDSLLAIIMLTDENDCSIRQSGQYWVVGRTDGSYRLPRARTECATDPNDPCCASCAQGTPAGCSDDPTCTNPDGSVAKLSPEEDQPNLRCFDQKRRFGIDFLYPISRYTEGFSSVTITSDTGDFVANPIFSDLNPNDKNSAIRDPGLVFFAGIVGVPWQDIARDPTNLELGFKDPDEMLEPNASGYNTWDLILGDPANGVDPIDPLMWERVDPRDGPNVENPVLGEPLQPATNYNQNPINGNEYTVANRDDLQYACIFDLLDPATGLPDSRDCTDPNNNAGCDCPLTNTVDKQTDKPLCDPDPANDHIQIRAKAYPGVRLLQTLKSMGGQGIVGSVCPAQLSDGTRKDFGYRPAIQSIIDRLKTKLGGQCLPRTLIPDPSGQVSCLIIEASNTNNNCDCTANGRSEIPVESAAAKQAAQNDPSAANADCFCAVTQLTGDQLIACQEDTNDAPVVGGAPIHGWCYIDATTSPPVGNPLIVQGCPDTEKRLIRFVGDGEAQAGATLFITCTGGNL